MQIDKNDIYIKYSMTTNTNNIQILEKNDSSLERNLEQLEYIVSNIRSSIAEEHQLIDQERTELENIKSEIQSEIELLSEQKDILEESVTDLKSKMGLMSMGSGDVVKMNVGGTVMASKRSTLCQIQGSLLASMFGGSWDDSLDLDEDGNIFLDFNPVHFSTLLDYLRTRKYDRKAKFPVVTKGQSAFKSMVQYLGITGFDTLSSTECQGLLQQFLGRRNGNNFVATIGNVETNDAVKIWSLFVPRQNGVFIGVVNRKKYFGWCISSNTMKEIGGNTHGRYSTRSHNGFNGDEVVFLRLDAHENRMHLETSTSNLIWEMDLDDCLGGSIYLEQCFGNDIVLENFEVNK